MKKARCNIKSGASYNIFSIVLLLIKDLFLSEEKPRDKNGKIVKSDLAYVY